jgi:hypothetical protein
MWPDTAALASALSLLQKVGDELAATIGARGFGLAGGPRSRLEAFLGRLGDSRTIWKFGRHEKQQYEQRKIRWQWI